MRARYQDPPSRSRVGNAFRSNGSTLSLSISPIPSLFQGHGTLDANEMGWKDTVRVNPGELVSIAATFDGFTGRFMYHCHLLEHEDHDMMRPFIVMPAAAMAAMDMPMPDRRN
jgi:FtsP/CotA-like multicopper oxidase with cupredoxin domain